MGTVITAAFPQVSETTAKAITLYSTHVYVTKQKGKKMTTTICDGLLADGITPEMLFSPEDKEDKAAVKFYNSLLDMVRKGFSANAQKMIASGARALKAAGKEAAEENRDLICKENASYWIKQPQSVLKDIRNSLSTRLKKAAKAEGGGDGADGEDGEDGETTGKNYDVKWLERLCQIQKQADGEPSTQCDLVEFLKHIKGAIAVLAAAGVVAE